MSATNSAKFPSGVPMSRRLVAVAQCRFGALAAFEPEMPQC